MRLRLVAPTRRKDSSNLQFEQRIPADLKDRLVGMTLEVPRGDGTVPITITDNTRAVRFSLGASDKGEAKQRQAAAIAYLESLYANMRANVPASLTHKQCVALSGELYRAWAAGPDGFTTITFEADEQTGRVERVHDVDLDHLGAGFERTADWAKGLDGSEAERRLGPIVERLLLRRGIASVTAETRSLLSREFARALADGMAAGAKKTGGDYSPDAKSERFPEWSPPQGRTKPASASLQGLFDAWWKEAERAGKSISTKESFGKAVATLGEFLCHDDAERITEADMIRFKEHLLEAVNPRTKKRLSMKTIGGSYFGGINVC